MLHFLCLLALHTCNAPSSHPLKGAPRLFSFPSASLALLRIGFDDAGGKSVCVGAYCVSACQDRGKNEWGKGELRSLLASGLVRARTRAAHVRLQQERTLSSCKMILSLAATKSTSAA